MYKTTYTYFLSDKSDSFFPLFQTTFGNALRSGLCIVESQNIQEIRLVKRGLPKLYEINESKNKCVLFHKKLLRFVGELFHNKSVKTLTIYQGKILSDINVQISYDSKHNSWIICTKKQYSVVFRDQNDINQLLQNEKINFTLHEVCQHWLNILSKMSYANAELYKDFLIKCDKKTLIGYYENSSPSSQNNNNGKKLIFELFVYNMEQFTQFSASFGEMDFFFQKYNLPYNKLERLNQYQIQNVEQFEKVVHDLYKLTAFDLTENSMNKGSIFFLSSEAKHITTGFKIKKREFCVSSQLTKSLVSKPGFISEKCVNSQIKHSGESFRKILGTCILHNNTNCKCQPFAKKNHIQKTTVEGNLFLIENNSYISERDEYSNDGRSNLVLLPNCLADIQKIKSNGTSINNVNTDDEGNGIRTPVQKSSNGNSNKQITKSLSKLSKPSIKDYSIRELSTFDNSAKYKLFDFRREISGNNMKKTNSSQNVRVHLSTINSFTNTNNNDTTHLNVTSKSSVNKIGETKIKKRKNVRFVDEKYYIPLVEVIDIKSYKKYYCGKCGNSDENKKNTCCVIM